MEEGEREGKLIRYRLPFLMPINTSHWHQSFQGTQSPADWETRLGRPLKAAVIEIIKAVVVVVVIITYEGNPEAVGWDTKTSVPEKPLMDPINTQADQGSEVRGQTPGLKTRFRAGAARDPKLRGDTQNPPRVRFLTFFGRGGQKAKAQADPGLRGPRGGGEGDFPQVRPPGVGETDAEGGGPGQPTRHGPAGAVPSAPRPPPPGVRPSVRATRRRNSAPSQRLTPGPADTP